MELDKWQQRQAQQLAEDEGISYEEAVARLFPAPVNEAPAAPEPEAPAAGKVSTAKSAA